MTHHMTTRTICRATKYLVAAPTRNNGSNGATDGCDQVATESARDYHHSQHARRTNGLFLVLLTPGGPQICVTVLGGHQRIVIALLDDSTGIHDEYAVPGSSLGKLMSDHQCCASGNSGLCQSEEHTSELQSRFDLVCRLLL